MGGAGQGVIRWNTEKTEEWGIRKDVKQFCFTFLRKADMLYEIAWYTYGEIFMASLNFRIDDDLKEKADAFYSANGISPTQAVTGLYQYVADYGKLPFDIRMSVTTDADLYRQALEQTQHVFTMLVLVRNCLEKERPNRQLINRIFNAYATSKTMNDKAMSVIKNITEETPNGKRIRPVYYLWHDISKTLGNALIILEEDDMLDAEQLNRFDDLLQSTGERLERLSKGDIPYLP